MKICDWFSSKFKHDYAVFVENSKNGRQLRYRFHNEHERNRVVYRGGEKEFFELILSEIDPYDLIYDVGANVGLYTVHFAAAAVNGGVVSFEPDPLMFKRLKENVRINRFRNVNLHQVALADENNTLELFTDFVGQYSSSLKFQEGRSGAPSGKVNVPVQTLDDFVARHPRLSPSVLKIDVEGAEGLLLKGATRLFSGEYGDPPNKVFVEIHAKFMNYFGGIADDVYEYLSGFGYTIVKEIIRNDESQVFFKKAR